MPHSVKVAVIGSGLAGLTAAYLLTEQTHQCDVEFELHLFEKASTLGMDSSSISVPFPDGDRSWRVDVPMRSFQGGYYPQLIALYKKLGVAFQEADFSYSFSLLFPPTSTRVKQITATMIYNGNSGLGGLSMPSLLDEPYHSTKGRGLLVRAFTKAWTVGLFLYMTMCITVCFLRMLFLSVPIWRSNDRKTSFAEWAEKTVPTNILARWTGMDSVWRDYTQTVLLPLFSAICTAPEHDIQRHPVEEFLDYIWLTLDTHHYVVLHGVQDVVARLTSPLRHIHLSTTISAISPDPLDSRLASIHCNTPRGRITHSGFHHIIFATQATRAVPLLSSYSFCLQPDDPKRLVVEKQIECLGTFKYRPSVVINHTDSTLMPDNPKDRRELNFVCLDSTSGLEPIAPVKWEDRFCDNRDILPPSYTMTTHILTRPTGFPAHLPDIYQTTNPIIPPRTERVLSVATLERAIVTAESKEALKGLYWEDGRKWWQCAGQGNSLLGELQGAGRLFGVEGPGLWICGSFAAAGIPLLEGCVVSARNVVEQGIWKAEGIQ